MNAEWIFGPAVRMSGIVESYVHLKDEVFSKEGWGLFDFDPSSLYAAKALLFVGIDPSSCSISPRVIAGLNVVIDGASNAYIQGVIVHPAYRKQQLSDRLIAFSLNVLRSPMGIERAALCVRVLPGGQINFAASQLFARHGFINISGGPTVVTISGTWIDRHLYNTAEPDGLSFCTQKMERSL